MWNLEETNKVRLLVLGRLMLSNKKLVLHILNLSLKLIQLNWHLRRLVVFIKRALLEQICSSKKNLISKSEVAQRCITLKQWPKSLYISYLMIENLTVKCQTLFRTVCRTSYFRSLTKNWWTINHNFLRS